MRPLSDVFDLRPLGEIRVGGVAHPIPPLTFGRLQALLAELASLDVRRVAEADKEAIYPALATVVPTVTREEWLAHGSLSALGDVVLALANGHDWNLIESRLALAGPREPGKAPDAAEEIAALLAFCRQNPAYRVEDLLAMRAEGFLALVVREPRAEVLPSIPGVESERDVTHASALGSLLNEERPA